MVGGKGNGWCPPAEAVALEFSAAHCAHLWLLQAASSLTAALEDFVRPEQLDGDNCYKCNT